MSTTSDARFMALALSLGKRAAGRVAPWPAVGCVLVKEGRIVGRGWSDRATLRHAERMALDQAGEQARGATAFVTLEPCSHHGSTPPCADALVAAGVVRVVAATGDPNPQVAGQGFARLRDAGVTVETGLMEAQARCDHEGFLSVVENRRPRVTLKLAASLDGRIATASGQSKWITGPQARRLVHAMRLRHDAVMVGGGTARADDPSLTVRGMGAGHQPVRVVLSRRLDLPMQSKLAESAQDVPLWLVHGPDVSPDIAVAWAGLGAKLLQADLGATRQLDPASALKGLANAGITSVFCEGGGALAASLLEAGLVDDLVTFNAGLPIGAEGQPMVGALGIGQLAEAPRFDLHEARAIGSDTVTFWRRRA